MQAFETLYIQIMEIQCRTDDNYTEIFNQMIVMFGGFIHAKLRGLLLHQADFTVVCIVSNSFVRSLKIEVTMSIMYINVDVMNKTFNPVNYFAS